METELEIFLAGYLEKVKPLSTELNNFYFKASVEGKKEDYEKVAELQLKLSRIFSDKNDFKKLQEFKNSDEVKDPLLLRQLTIIYNEFASHQFDEKVQEEIIKLATKVEEDFSTFRASIGEKKLTDNQIDDILETSEDNGELEETWNVSKQIGEIVAPDVLKLVKLRNTAAQSMGYKNYHQMSLKLSEQDPEEIEHLFDNLDELTRSGFSSLKEEMDGFLSEKYSIDKKSLMPWHYQDKFFQQGPKIFKVDFDKYFKGKDIVKITRDYYNGMGLNIDDLIENSDLFEKDGKYQHAYCMNLDREGDVRVVCNVKDNHRWTGTMLHEYGHAVYDKYISPKLPWVLREPAHIFVTEAIAMLFGRFAYMAAWLKDVAEITENEVSEIDEPAQKQLRLSQLVFTRWVQVIYRFEKSMYENPEQDLNSLWWSLVEKYQQIKKPEGRNKPDWAAKIHIALYPAYYHNYMLGELLASQLFVYITRKVLKEDDLNGQSFKGRKEAGEYLKYLYFSYGSLYRWNELILKATGEELTPKYYAEQFVDEKILD